jgi:hypothetical protein
VRQRAASDSPRNGAIRLAKALERANPWLPPIAARRANAQRELTECMRENALTVIFPKSIATGQEQFQLTLRVDPPASGERDQSR